ncbi:MAG: phasin family protein [Planctomycetota bacterium]
MIDTLRNSILVGLGAVAFGQEKLRAALDELVERGELTAEQGRKLLEEFVRRGREESRTLLAGLAAEISRLPERMPVVLRREYARLESRVEELERRLGVAPSEGAGPPLGSPEGPAPSSGGAER